ncbi:MAG: cupredoxin domain-containing protein, partial [Acidimicrobiia bacterium]|nr:cupredoxin domain-containing protein [Acidimicrobiia bacterium]
LTVLAACGSDSASVDLSGKTFTRETGKRAITIDAVDNNFKPQFVTVSAGTKVTFKNVGRNLHNVYSVGDTFTSIATPDFGPDEQGSVTFDRAGDYPYYCTLHGTPTRGMTGAIRVVT